ncbi:MAG: hypothetical protein Q8O76_02355, partial [Chloroflexota bacterium]|nr:hypothetical protein [Chloroflexota bacterium]
MAEEKAFNIEVDLGHFSPSLLREYLKALPLVRRRLPSGDFEAWAQEGLNIARHCPRSWEAALEYFKASPQVIEVLEFPYVIPWGRWGLKLAGESPALASAYFKASPQVVTYLMPHRLGDWTAMVQSVYKGTWRSSAFCCSFFEASPKLLRYLTLEEMERFAHFLDTLAQHSHDV